MRDAKLEDSVGAAGFVWKSIGRSWALERVHPWLFLALEAALVLAGAVAIRRARSRGVLGFARPPMALRCDALERARCGGSRASRSDTIAA